MFWWNDEPKSRKQIEEEKTAELVHLRGVTKMRWYHHAIWHCWYRWRS